jgi:DHA1 family bicyclomycin/chloramphenicol resistance-like MFS transporter
LILPRAHYTPLNTHLLNSRSFVITLGLLTAIAALTVDLSLPAIPAMADALSTSLSRSQKIVGVFMAGMAFGQIPAGLFSDRLGRLPTLYAGMTLFVVAAMATAVADNIELLLLARFIQGMGAASAVVMSRAIVRDIASGREAARLMSLMTMIFTAAPVIAPTFGALLVAQWGWRAPFIAIAVCGFLMIFAIRSNFVETHRPVVSEHPLKQLVSSFREFFSYRQSIFGLLLMLLPPAGFMSVIAVSSALTVDIYGYSVQAYGLIFACAGLSILAGSVLNRILVSHLDPLKLIAIGVGFIFAASAQLTLIAWLDSAPIWWLWSCVCLFLGTIPMLLSNSLVVALDPLPKIAGVASSIIGTLQNLAGASGALLGAAIYNGSVRRSVLIIGAVGLAVAVVFLLRPLIAPGNFVHHPEELARD